jgi:hypothetical protein
MPILEARGLSKFLRNLKLIESDLPARFRVANLEVAQALATEIAAAAPRGTMAEGDKHPGKLAAATKPIVTPGRAKVQIGRGLLYAKPIIFGWRAHNITPNPYPYSVVDARRGEILAKYKAALQKALSET